MPGVVAFDYAGWLARYPVFACVTSQTAQAYFDEAGSVYLNNTAGSPVQDLGRRQSLLWMLTAHLAALYSGVNGQAPSGVVGRVTQATEGSVSVSFDAGPSSEQSAFFMQTPYGFAFWRATAGLRRARWIPGCPQRPRIWP